MQDESDTYRTAVANAVRVVGGAEELAQRLGATQSEVERWVRGDSKPSMGTFLKVIDILLEEDRKPRPYSGNC